MVKIILPIADGTEEMEAVITADVLRRAKWDVTICTIDKEIVIMSRNVRILADTSISNIADKKYDILVLPGGANGVENFLRCEVLLELTKKMIAGNCWVAAICAAPLVLHKIGVLSDKKFTCHPSVKEKFAPLIPSEERVVVNNKIITAQGPGVTFEFALKIIEVIEGKQRADAMHKELLLR